MHMSAMAKSLRLNHDEVIRRWMENLHGHIADDFEEMLQTPMGNGVAGKLLDCAVDYLETEEYNRSEILHMVWNVARDASFRRTAVGYGLQDIVTTALAFRNALQQTILNNLTPCEAEQDHELVGGLLAVDRIGDAIISGEIAGYFSYLDFRDEEDERREIA